MFSINFGNKKLYFSLKRDRVDKQLKYFNATQLENVLDCEMLGFMCYQHQKSFYLEVSSQAQLFQSGIAQTVVVEITGKR